MKDLKKNCNRIFNMQKYIISIGLMLTLMVFTACDVHQWPEPNNETGKDEPSTPTPPPDVPDEPLPSKTVKLALNLKYFTEFTYQHHTYDVKTGAVSPSSETTAPYDNIERLQPGTPLQVTLKVHRNNSNRTLVLSETFVKELDVDFDSDIEIEVPSATDYLITAWAHILDGNGDALYDAADFNSIKLIKEKYTGNTDLRDAFRGRLAITAPEEGYLYGEVEMHRPMGKLEFVTTDLKEFLANEQKREELDSRGVSPENYSVVISYPAWYPTNYMAMEDRLEFSSQGYGFSSSFSIPGSDATESSLGFDYVLINSSNDEAVQAQVTVYHSDGTLVSSTGVITVPMQRDYHTVLKGNFLTANGKGGVGLDTDFEGDFNIPVY